MSNYTIYPSNDVKQVSGSAVTATSTNVDGGVGKGLGANRTLLTNLGHGKRNQAYYGSVVVAGANVGSAAWVTSSATAITSVADSGTADKAKFTLNSHGLVVGDIINITGSTSGVMDGVHRITAKDANTFTTDRPYVAAADPGSFRKSRGNFARMTAGKYIIVKVTTELAGLSNTVLRSGGSAGYRRSIHKMEAMRTTRVATAIRAGYWNIYSASWATKPTTANDISTFGTDQAATPTYAIPGELVYKTGKLLPVMDDYKSKTN